MRSAAAERGGARGFLGGAGCELEKDGVRAGCAAAEGGWEGVLCGSAEGEGVERGGHLRAPRRRRGRGRVPGRVTRAGLGSDDGYAPS